MPGREPVSEVDANVVTVLIASHAPSHGGGAFGDGKLTDRLEQAALAEVWRTASAAEL